MSDTMDFRIKLTRDTLFSLDVEGQIPLTGVTAITGPSGGGKTTLLRSLAGLERSGQADVQFRGKSWDAGSHHTAVEDRRIGFVFQSPALFPHLDVAGNLRYGARRREISSYDAIIDALDLGALMSRRIDGLSGGEARRVALARAMASSPQVLFLDEPLSGLDSAQKTEVLPYIGRAVVEAKVPALYVSHSIAEVTALADRVLGISGGRLTGWQSAPARLSGTVTAVDQGTMRVLLQGAEPGQGGDFTLPLIAGLGEKVGLGLPPDSLLVSADPPGRSDALTTLPARVVAGDSGLTLNVFGQTITLPRAAPHALDAQLWVTVLKVLPRIEPGDSAEISR